MSNETTASVWVVDEGEYSDYRILAIFATKPQAEEFVSHRGPSSPYGYSPGMQEWELNTWTEDKATFKFTFDLNGNITKVSEVAYVDDAPTPALYSQRHTKDEVLVVVNYGPRDRATKVASEHYTRIRAFLDEAQKMGDRAHYDKISEGYCFGNALRVARILAGIEQAPNPPQCDSDRNILTILGIPEVAQ